MSNKAEEGLLTFCQTSREMNKLRKEMNNMRAEMNNLRKEENNKKQMTNQDPATSVCWVTRRGKCSENLFWTEMSRFEILTLFKMATWSPGFGIWRSKREEISWF